MKLRIITPAIVLPAIENGMDYGTKRRLLARLGGKQGSRLIWQPGANCWSSIRKQTYYPGEFVFDGPAYTWPKPSLKPFECGAKTFVAAMKTDLFREFVREHLTTNEAFINALGPRHTVEAT